MAPSVPFNELKRIHDPLREELNEVWSQLLTSNRFIQGPAVQDFEKEFAETCQSGFSIGVSSGTDALLVSLMALGVGPGDEVITTPFTFFATAGVISRLGATPVFADIDPRSFNLDPEDVGRKITTKTRVILAVHLFGQMADMAGLSDLIKGSDIHLIEDAAQSVGAENSKGEKAGSLGTVGCFSFFPAKNLGCFGDGGAVTTQDEDLAKRISALRSHGAVKKYYHDQVGGNFRLDALQASILSVKLKHLDTWTEQRRVAAQNLRTGLNAIGVPNSLQCPQGGEGRHVYNQFVIRTDRRDQLQSALKQAEIGTAVYYPKPLHLQPCFASLGYGEGDLPEAEKACHEVLALPNFPGITVEESSRVVHVIEQFFAQGR